MSETSESGGTVKIRMHICGKVCDAGGPEHQGGHKFTVPWESDDHLSSGFECEKCGLDNMSWSMWAGEEN